MLCERPQVSRFSRIKEKVTYLNNREIFIEFSDPENAKAFLF